jgi:hypothetical protein
MMLRIIFTGLATCVLLLAAGVRFAREDAPPRVREALGSAVERAIESAKQALPGPPAQASREPAQEAPAPAPSTAASPAASPPASKPMDPPEPAAAQTPAHEVESVTEESISPLWSAPFVESPEAGAGGAREGDPEQQAPPARISHHPSTAAAPSHDEWAGLIRRMLAIYERVGAAE